MSRHALSQPSPRIRRWLLATLSLLLTLVTAGSIGVAVTASANAQSLSSDGIWMDSIQSAAATQSRRAALPTRYRTVRLNGQALQQLLQTVPLERSVAAQSTPVIFSLPLPDGAFGRFQIVESPVMAQELAAKFPAIKTYAGQGIDDPTATVRFDWTPAGFHAQILAAGDVVYIDPYSRNDTVYYISYYKRDYQRPAGKGIKEAPQPSVDPARIQELQTLVKQYQAGMARNTQVAAAVGAQLRTYRLAMASNGEYTQLVGGTVADALAAIATTVNRVTGIFETEVAIRFVLVAGNDALIYTDPNTDPYTNADTVAMLTENQDTLDNVIGNGNYDIGHLLHTGPGGVAYTGAVCDNSIKGGGNSGNGNDSVGDPFIVDFVAHEIGHQFSAGHIFNTNDPGGCGPNRGGATAYEPGSGSTIMSYAGVCGSEDLQPHNDPFFNTASFDEIVAYSTLGLGNSCPVITNTGNTPPLVNAGTGGFTIPKQTPFTLTGSATDADGDVLTYSWEEHDLGDADGTLGNPPNPLEAPFFRSFAPVSSPSRTFPKWSDIINTTTTIGEVLPNVTRSLTFRLTARDNQGGGGGVDYDEITFHVTTAAGPFLVTAPNTDVTWAGSSSQTVTWNVANTDAAPVSCATVNILLSTDGGLTYPTTLATGVPNNGSASVTVPTLATTTARVQVACATSIFFDISNTNFTITTAVNTPTSTATATPTTPANTPTHTPTATPTVPVSTPTSTATATPTVPGNTPTSTPTPTATTTPIAGSDLVYISSSTNAKVDGLSFRDEDILVYNQSTDQWAIFFDGTDVGVGNADLDGFALLDDGSILMSFDVPINFPTIGMVDDADIVKFTPTQLGPNTSGSFTLFFDGSAVGLTTGSEDIDALAYTGDGKLLISTYGTATVGALRAQDEDLLRFTPAALGATTAGTWELFFDGSAVGLTTGREDVTAALLNGANSLYLATKGKFAASSQNTIAGDGDDIFGCALSATGLNNTQCTFFALFDGDTVRFNRPIDGLSVGLDPVSTLFSADNSTAGEPEQFEIFPDEVVGDDVEFDSFDTAESEETSTGEVQIYLPLISRE